MLRDDFGLDETCPVDLLQNEWEFRQLLRIYRPLLPKNVLEIGSFYGGTLWYWLNTAHIRLQKIVSIDWPIPSTDSRYKQMIESRAKWDSWVKDTNELQKRKSPIELIEIIGDSTSEETIMKANAHFPDKDIDFLFIDGGHDYNTVKSDYENYSKLVKSGGLIVFHDVIGLEEVRQYWNELKSSVRYIEICESRNVGWGIGIVYV